MESYGYGSRGSESDYGTRSFYNNPFVIDDAGEVYGFCFYATRHECEHVFGPEVWSVGARGHDECL